MGEAVRHLASRSWNHPRDPVSPPGLQKHGLPAGAVAVRPDHRVRTCQSEARPGWTLNPSLEKLMSRGGKCLHSKTLDKLGAEQGPPLGSFAAVVDAVGQILGRCEYRLQMPHRHPFPEGYVHPWVGQRGSSQLMTVLKYKRPARLPQLGPTLRFNSHSRAPPGIRLRLHSSRNYIFP